jgi:hypothetical protein
MLGFPDAVQVGDSNPARACRLHATRRKERRAHGRPLTSSCVRDGQVNHTDQRVDATWRDVQCLQTQQRNKGYLQAGDPIHAGACGTSQALRTELIRRT